MLTLQQKKRGFSLIEVLVSIFIFAIVMTAVAKVFGQSVAGYRYARVSQQTMEDVQFAINHIAKSLRTSSVQSVGSGGQSIVIYDYSRGNGACVRYTIGASAITEEVKPLNYNSDDVLRCNSSAFGGVSFVNLTTLPVTGRFSAQKSEYATRVGKVSMVFAVEDVRGAVTHVQTTVSLRDYDVSGLL